MWKIENRNCKLCNNIFTVNPWSPKVFCTAYCGYKNRKKTIQERFNEKVLPPNENGCMLWIGGKGKQGHGRFEYNNRLGGAHRYSYELHIGEITKGMFVCHKCDIPSCVNPEHLFLGSPKDNMIDAKNKGRGNCGRFENHGSAKLSKEEVKQIRDLYNSNIYSQAELSRLYNIKPPAMGSIVHNKTWRNI